MAAGAGGKNPDIKGGAGNRRREGRKWDSQGSGNCEIIGGKLLQHHKIFSTRKSTIKKLEPLRKGSDGVKGTKSKKFRPSVSSPPPKKRALKRAVMRIDPCLAVIYAPIYVCGKLVEQRND